MIIKVDKEDTVRVEALQYEVESRKQVVGYLVSANLMGSESFNKYNQDYLDYFVQYEKAKADIEEKYIKPKCPNFISWNLDFKSSEITVGE